MNKGNLNKLVTNYPVELTEEEIANLSGTLAPVVAACGGGGGGGTGGKIYTGVGFVTVNNTTNQIGLTNEANTKLNQDIPTKVSDLSDSANYQTVAGMDEYLTTANAASTYQTIDGMNDYVGQQEYNNFKNTTNSNLNNKQNKLNFGYDENNAISSIDGHKLAGAGGVTGDYYSASNPSGFINSAQAETQILAKNYITSGVSELANFYSKTDTSSKTEIENAFDNIPKYILNGDSNITATSAQDGKNVRWDLSVNATPVVTDTTLTGEKGIYTHTTTKSGEWCVELVQSAYDAINDVQNKLNTTDFNTYTATTAPSIYQPIGNYLSSNALEGYATQQWVGQQGYITQETDWTNTIQEASAKAYNDATANANSLYQAKGDYVKNTDIGLDANNKITAISGKELIITAHQSLTNYYTKDETSGATQLAQAFANLPGGGITEVSHDTTLTGKGNSTQNLGVAWSALSSNTIDYSNSAFNLTNGTSVSSFDQISAAIDSRYSKTSSDNRYLQKSLDSTLTGDGSDSSHKLGVAWSALSANTINSANSAGEAKGFRWGDNSYQDTSAALTNLWNAKNHVTLQTANNFLTVDNNDNTSATLSAMSYVANSQHAGWLPQKSCVCQESEIYGMSQLADGQGMLFFVVSAH